MQVYVDCDGVLADFDKHAVELLGSSLEHYENIHGTPKAWADLFERDPDFFFNLDPLPGALEFLNRVINMTINVGMLRPKILTGMPKFAQSAEQKQRWRMEHVPYLEMITCKSRDKRNYCAPGDVLIDDMLKYSHLWKKAGGHFIHHTDQTLSLGKFAEYIF